MGLDIATTFGSDGVLLTGPVINETEKAVCVQVRWVNTEPAGRQKKEHFEKVWIPKSKISNGVIADLSFWQVKYEIMKARINQRFRGSSWHNWANAQHEGGWVYGAR